MASSVTICLKDASTKDRTALKQSSGYLKKEVLELRKLIDQLDLGGVTNAGATGAGQTIYVDVSTAALAFATGTVTCASVTAADTVTVNGVVFTAVSGSPAANEFDISGTDTADATSLAAAINSSVTANVTGCVTATSSGAVVTLTSTVPGLIGNCQTLASSNGTRLAVSGARLTGGTGGTSASGPTSYAFGA